MAQDSEVDFFFLFATKNVAFLVETNDTWKFIRDLNLI